MTSRKGKKRMREEQVEPGPFLVSPEEPVPFLVSPEELAIAIGDAEEEEKKAYERAQKRRAKEMEREAAFEEEMRKKEEEKQRLEEQRIQNSLMDAPTAAFDPNLAFLQKYGFRGEKFLEDVLTEYDKMMSGFDYYIPFNYRVLDKYNPTEAAIARMRDTFLHAAVDRVIKRARQRMDVFNARKGTELSSFPTNGRIGGPYPPWYEDELSYHPPGEQRFTYGNNGGSNNGSDSDNDSDNDDDDDSVADLSGNKRNTHLDAMTADAKQKQKNKNKKRVRDDEGGRRIRKQRRGIKGGMRITKKKKMELYKILRSLGYF